MVVFMAGAVAVGYFSDSIYTFYLQKTGQLAISAMRSDLYAHILSMPRSFFDQRPIGVILTRLTSDMEALNDSLAIGVLSIFTDFLKTIALLILLIILSWKLTLVVLLILPPIYFCQQFSAVEIAALLQSDSGGACGLYWLPAGMFEWCKNNPVVCSRSQSSKTI